MLIRKLKVNDLETVQIATGSDVDPDTEARLIIFLKTLAVRKNFSFISFVQPSTSSEILARIGELTTENNEFWTEPYSPATFH